MFHFSIRNSQGQLNVDKKYRRLVLVFGPARSGTTLLNRVLSGGSHHRIFTECTLITSIIKTMISHKHSTPDRFEQYFDDQATMLEGYRLVLNNIIGTLLREEPEREILFLKDPGILEAFDGYWELFPESEFIGILRNPMEVLASRSAVAERAGRVFAWDQEIERVREDIRRTVSLVRRFSETGRLLLVGYSDLTTDVHGTVARLEERLNMKISPELEKKPGLADSHFTTERSELSQPQSQKTALGRLPSQIRAAAEDSLAEEIKVCERIVAKHR